MRAERRKAEVRSRKIWLLTGMREAFRLGGMNMGTPTKEYGSKRTRYTKSNQHPTTSKATPTRIHNTVLTNLEGTKKTQRRNMLCTRWNEKQDADG